MLKKVPQLIDLPKLNYFMIVGAGNPNSDEFANNIEVLYLLSYAVRMSYKTEFVDELMLRVKDKKKNEKIDDVKFIELDEGKCVQMLHLGSYDNEKDTFDIMGKYCEDNGF